MVNLTQFIALKHLFYLFLSVILMACSDENNTSQQNNDIEYTGQLIAIKDRQYDTNIAELNEYMAAVKQSLNSPLSILLLTKQQLKDDEAYLAQSIAIKNKKFIQFTRHPNNNTALRNEIMTVRKTLASDKITTTGEKVQGCDKHCYRVEMYNFFYNMSSIAFVDVKNRRLLDIQRYSDAQPDLNEHLTALAIAIAKNSPLVQKELKTVSNDIEPTMSQIKTSLKDSRCERSHHLCVAPTFVIGDRALWAIVDLTEGQLVGTRWTELGDSGPPITVTERRLENEFVFNEFCEKTRHYSNGQWQFDYQITPSDGLELTQVKYNNKTVMNSAKLLDWHVSYSTREGFGYSDAIGCPLFSSAVVVAYEGPQVEIIKQDQQEIGFAFIQDFRQAPWPTPCNYRYEQRFEFYHDGRFRVAAADYGRGCGTDGTYRPIIRMDIEANHQKNTELFSQWNGQQWQQWETEQWHLQSTDTAYTEQGYLFKIHDENNQGFYIEPNRGQFNDGSKGDFAYSYVTVNHKDTDEGKKDMVTMGSCCNTNHEQGPEQFIKPAEPLNANNLVLWYVPQMKNEGKAGQEYCWADTRIEKGIKKVKVWPCFAGPMFIPINQNNE